MDILIKGMEMPEEGERIAILIKSNGKCSYFRQEDTEYGICEPIQTGIAIQIPTPHGRLIDADALDKELRRKWNYGDSGVTIANAPTIVEAEE